MTETTAQIKLEFTLQRAGVVLGLGFFHELVELARRRVRLHRATPIIVLLRVQKDFQLTTLLEAQVVNGEVYSKL